MKSKINVTLKASILDPQGSAVKHAVENLGFNNVNSVRIGKYIEVEINTSDKKIAEEMTKKMCEKLLVNEVIETYSFQIEA
jgi:phosphoribosylformylglycinamidine synthase PurS subunit